MRLLQTIGLAFNLPGARALRARELKLIVAASDADRAKGAMALLSRNSVLQLKERAHRLLEAHLFA
jgi:hypothetical protein